MKCKCGEMMRCMKEYVPKDPMTNWLYCNLHLCHACGMFLRVGTDEVWVTVEGVVEKGEIINTATGEGE